MSDDAAFYPRFRFMAAGIAGSVFREYGHVLPPVDNGFLGNWKNSAWRNWQMRFQRPRIFAGYCSCAAQRLPDELLAVPTLVRMLPLCLSRFHCRGPILSCWKCVVIHRSNGTLNSQLASQANSYIARQNHLPCIGLGYGFSEDAYRCVWAFNKFLGSGCGFRPHSPGWDYLTKI